MEIASPALYAPLPSEEGCEGALDAPGRKILKLAQSLPVMPAPIWGNSLMVLPSRMVPCWPDSVCSSGAPEDSMTVTSSCTCPTWRDASTVITETSSKMGPYVDFLNPSLVKLSL